MKFSVGDKFDNSDASSLYWLPLLVGLVPTVLIGVTFLISASHGQVPWCMPFVDGCTSISRAGRNPPAIFLFRSIMLPICLLLAAYWILSLAWIRSLFANSDRRPSAWMAVVGVAGALLLVIYVTFLGSEGSVYQLMRRFGASLFYGLTFLAQLIQIRWLTILRREQSIKPPWLPLALSRLALLMLLAGLTQVIISGVTPSEEFQNIAEWNFTAMLNAHFLLCAWGWRESGFSAAIGLRAER